ncbi:hypothetical protein CYMTET_53445 [Cymbomonas tetramitiformis]|uniref:Uncharacterized protein n=1 Tax=Cymbomonas tetramitiformis TaxID=36881 RepID=A0AAE0BI45_9CHLO|nr:hypothetical protein CYMTET_53445 [Cymbomonas tetramitiformis]
MSVASDQSSHTHLGICITLTYLVVAASTAELPVWHYHGYNAFPANFFGANESGLESKGQLAFVARHQLSGWGWQVDQQHHWKGGASEPPCHGGCGFPVNYSFDESERLFANAQRLTDFLEHEGGATQGIFAYRQATQANWWFKVDGRDATSAHPEHFYKATDGKLCWQDGPLRDFRVPGAMEYYLSTTIEELCNQAATGDLTAVFFDGVDAGGVRQARVNQSFYGGSNCSWGDYDMHTLEARTAMWAAYRDTFTRAAVRLNECGLWPIYSMGSAMDTQISTARGYPGSLSLFVDALETSGASWARYYEFWGWSAAGYGIRDALSLTARGVPLVMHSYPGRGGPYDITMGAAMFLMVQSEYSYFGASVGGIRNNTKFGPWDDPGWIWHDLYDEKPGKPIGDATFDTATAIWRRSFTNCEVSVDEKYNKANITMLSPRREFVQRLSSKDLEWQEGEWRRIQAFK